MPTPLKTRFEPFLWRLIRRVTRTTELHLPPLTAEDLEQIKSRFPLEKFFVTGHARSGTTLLGRLIRTHPEVHCDWTGHFVTHSPTFVDLLRDPSLRAKFGDPTFRWNEGRDSSSLFLRAAIDFLMEKNADKLGKHIVGDKSPNTFANDAAVRYLASLYPDGKLIYIVRDGRDALVSQRFRQFIEFPERLGRADRNIRSGYIRNPDPFFNGRQSLFTRSGVRDRSIIWAQNVRRSTEAGRRLFGNRFLCLRFEDLLARPVEEIGKVWEFLGADPAGLADRIETEMGDNPVVSWQESRKVDSMRLAARGTKGTWRELFTPTDRQIFKRYAGEQLIDFGYETDDAW
jgi:hypothetical protein